MKNRKKLVLAIVAILALFFIFILYPRIKSINYVKDTPSEEVSK